ncbi:MAG: HEAT repeat domain-containing protein [Planctomycetes bacterium]|nr:HEAT repeat domain-containing protein [Planctomycetota bacterium]
MRRPHRIHDHENFMLTTRTTLLLTLLFLAPVVTAQENLQSRVGEAIARAADGDLDRVWEIGRTIVEFGDVDQEDALARAITTAATDSSELGRLAAAFALREIAEGSVFGKELFEILEPVCRSEDPTHRAAALQMLGDEGLFNRRLLPDVAKILRENVDSELLDPMVRLAATRSLWEIGSDEDRRKAKDTMLEFVRSRNRTIRVDAALALAEINTDSHGPGWDVLRDIAEEPSPEGRLARAYIERENQMREAQARIRRLMLGTMSTDGEDSFGVLRELLVRAHAQHIRGESFDDERLIESAAKGLTSSLDRHSTYFTSDEFQRFFFDLNREYAGIGAFVAFDRDGDFSITRPIYSGPAYRNGLKSGDKILQVDGWDTHGHTSEEIISRLKGEPNSNVTVQIFRAGLVDPEDITIEREQINVPSVNSELLPGNVGYLELVTFAQNTAEECRKHLRALQEQGATSFVLDVRNNTGGYLLAARDVVELFVPGRKLVVYTQGRDEEERMDYATRDRAVVPDAPLAVLVNGFSASASEITAGALQDHGRAVIVGERSFGKGSVQSILPMRSMPGEDFDDKNKNGQWDEWEEYTDRNGNGKYDVGAHVKLTVARYHLPSGRSLHKELDSDGRILNPDWGIMPDFEIDLRETSPDLAWKNAEIFRLYRDGKLQEYVKQKFPDHQKQFLEIANGDGGDTSLYPEFDEFFAGLDTHLQKDDVRRWLRYLIRDEVADLRGKAYPGGRAVGDFQEDAQLQMAVSQLLREHGEDIRDVPEYGPILKLTFAADGSAEPAPKKG